MMAMAQQFQHPGMPGHASLPHGHPMGASHPQSVPGGQPAMNPMHMAIGGSGGGAPQVGQAGMIGGMPQMGPGGHGPSPSQVHNQMIVQNAQMQAAIQANPQLAAEMHMRRQHQLIQHQQRQAMMQQNVSNQGNMMMTPGGQVPMMPNGMPAGPSMPRINLPAHLQAQIPPQGQPGQHPNAQHQQLMMQHVNLQAAHQAAAQQHMQQQLALQQASQGGPSPAQPAPNQPPVRPSSQMQNRSGQPGQPQEQNQGSSQTPQSQATPIQQPQQPPQQPQPNQHQPQQPQGQGQHQGQTHQSQAHMSGHPGESNLVNRRAFMAAQGALMQQMSMTGSQGACVLSLLSYADALGLARGDGRGTDVSYWQAFTARFFSPSGTLRQGLYNSRHNDSKNWEVLNASIPWYYSTFFRNGCQRIMMTMEQAQERSLAGGGHVVESPRTSFIYSYGRSHQVIITGKLQVIFDSAGKIQIFEHQDTENKEYIDRVELVPPPESSQESPSQGKVMSKKQREQRENKEDQAMLKHPSLLNALKRRFVNESAVPDKVQIFLETAGVFANMNPLFEFAARHQTLSASEVLKQVVANFTQELGNKPNNFNQHTPNVGNPGGPPGVPGMPPNQRTPGGLGTAFASPAPGAHLTLPGGKMTASPAMLAHGLPGGPPGQGGVQMVPNPSQGGGSGNPSANASPSVTGKKRRASAVKTEEGLDNTTVQGGESKVKPSPRMNGKRVKP